VQDAVVEQPATCHVVCDGTSVSLLIDTYNHERFIEKMIASVLEQRWIGDGTPEIIRKFARRRPSTREFQNGKGRWWRFWTGTIAIARTPPAACGERRNFRKEH
jgi:hypothetical protein